MEPEKLINALRETDDYIKLIYLKGGCYQFYKFLKTVYPEAEPYITFDKQHIVTKISNCFYDIRGRTEGIYYPLTEKDIEMCEGWSFYSKNWFYRECPNCGEYIYA